MYRCLIAMVAMVFIAGCDDDDGKVPDQDKSIEAGLDVSVGKEASVEAGQPDGPVAKKACICSSDSDCTAITSPPSFYKYCGPAGHCIQCKADSDCTWGVKKCNLTTGFCSACTTNADCNMFLATKTCDTSVGQCTEYCTDDSYCSAFKMKKCDLASHKCKECDADSDCSMAPKTGTGKCDVAVHKCQKCDTDVDCADNNDMLSRICGPKKVCSNCNTNADCLAKSDFDFKGCDTNGNCTLCTASSECAAYYPGGTNLKCQ